MPPRRRCGALGSPADTFARNLRRAREKAELSQEALADKAGMHRAEIPLLSAASASPKIRTVARLAKALGVKPSDLLKGA